MLVAIVGVSCFLLGAFVAMAILVRLAQRAARKDDWMV